MSPKNEQNDQPHSPNGRKSSRNLVRMVADLRLSVGQKFKVSVLDLSTTGFRIETGNYIELRSRVFLGIPDFQALPAVIAWNKGTLYGGEFVNPLHPSIFEHIAQKYPHIML